MALLCPTIVFMSAVISRIILPNGRATHGAPSMILLEGLNSTTHPKGRSPQEW
jgi:hypothetical protein